MKQVLAMALGVMLFGLAGIAHSPTALAQTADGWTTLLDGSNMDWFTPLGDANWRVVDGAVQADSGGGFLVSNGSYGDFELRVEFWATPDANSGIFIRCQDPEAVSDSSCYEVNIYDQRRTRCIEPVASSISRSQWRWSTPATSGTRTRSRPKAHSS